MGRRKRAISDEDSYQNKIEELRQRAAKDALSGLLNRATAEELIKKRIRNMSEKETCALFIVDLDDFKRVNDTLGHQAGDQAIRQSARILSGLFHANDIVGRLGGDELVIFICGTITDKFVREKAAEICESVQIALGDQNAISLTASVGVYLAGKGQEFEGLYQSADLALYKAKKAGKHRFCIKDHESYKEEKDKEFRPINTIPLNGLLENMESGVALVEMGTRPQIIYVSPSFCRIVGASDGGYPLPMPLDKFVHPDDMAGLEQELEAGAESGKSVENIDRVAAFGSDRWLWWHIRAIRVEYDNPHPVMLITATDISEFKESEIRLEEMNQRLQTAFEQTSKRLWDVDLQTRIFRAYTRDGKYHVLGEGREYFPEHLIDGGWIHPNSVSRFKEFAAELLNGRAQGYGNFAIRNKDTGFYSWVTISYRMLFDDVGHAVRAVGVLDELSQNFYSNEKTGSLRFPIPESLLADLIVRMRANLDMDTVESLWIEGSDLSSQVQKTRCSQIMQMEREKIFNKSDLEELADFFDRERLLNLYESGRRWLSYEYRRVDSVGNIRWVRHIIYICEDPESKQIYIYVYLIRLDTQYKFEISFADEIQFDQSSHLLEKESIRLISEKAFSENQSGNRAVAVFQINGLSNQMFGAGFDAELMYRETATALSLVLGGSCFFGRYSANQIIIVFPSVIGKEELRRRLEESVSYLRRIELGDAPFDSLRFIVGISLSPSVEANYVKMLDQALKVCEFWWNAPTDITAFAEESDEFTIAQTQTKEDDDEVCVHSSEMDRPLSESEKDVALECVSTMLNAKSLDASLMGVLRSIGTYYQADRVYTLILVENQHSVVMSFEWTGPNKRSIQQAVSGMRLDRFPILKRCIEERAPIFLTRKLNETAGIGISGEEWHFTVFPLIYGQDVGGFLCIENARKHPADAALFSKLIPHMLRERQRFKDGEKAASTADQLMGLPDLRAYMEAVYTLNSNRFSSLGVICLDIPDMATINSRNGFEYGSKQLWYVVTTLSDLFDPSLLFRTWDSEFIVFLPNTTREVFLGRCGRLRSILQRRYPKQVRIGYTWSDGKFIGKNLVDEAKALMHSEKTNLNDGITIDSIGINDFRTISEAVDAGKFMLYYQPKIDMRTGKMCGAEALVRGSGEDGAVISPAEFIEILENNGMIRDLDNFVLEGALTQMEKWKNDGYGVVPVSVNLSRVTLVHPSTLASVLAVQSRYPELPSDALELEITERGGIETSEFRKIVEKFRSCGLHVSLDDFGSQYANLPIFTNVKFDTVKLDRSLITDLATNPINHMVVRDLIQICHTYGITCVAEGVETEEQRDALLNMGCSYAQGYYYGRPMPAKEFEEKYLREKTGSNRRI